MHPVQWINLPRERVGTCCTRSPNVHFTHKRCESEEDERDEAGDTDCFCQNGSAEKSIVISGFDPELRGQRGVS